MSAGSSTETITLTFEPDNPCNSFISDDSTGEHLYTVVTQHGDETITKLTNAESGEQLAQWLWKDVRSDVFTLGNTKPQPSSAWLIKSMVPFKDTVHFKDLNGRNFKWKNCAPGLSLELYSDTDKKHPIAVWKKSYRYKDIKSSEQVYDPATLTVTGLGLEILDLVVISFCMLEKNRRINENGTVSVASSFAIPLLVVAGC
ncbi:hypothetical protein D9611_014476 [Ephemerocybe angulata]|uniref:DUF6593 domain-containing protein n=1 Tax=Ephemerocybe angulata TaxID=980116 RepID=A0A8H5C3R4_9AGAR|nr:hypothetical protein D9611_014476 [Tulosesus angulatus]